MLAKRLHQSEFKPQVDFTVRHFDQGKSHFPIHGR
jgi:hypothetical protein